MHSNHREKPCKPLPARHMLSLELESTSGEQNLQGIPYRGFQLWFVELSRSEQYF